MRMIGHSSQVLAVLGSKTSLFSKFSFSPSLLSPFASFLSTSHSLVLSLAGGSGFSFLDFGPEDFFETARLAVTVIFLQAPWKEEKDLRK